MKKNNLINRAEYLPLIFIISYFFLHKIILVIFGMIIALYFINMNYISGIINSINKLLKSDKSDKGFLTKNNKNENNNNYTEAVKKSPKLSLVEEVEELGFIPSKENNSENNAA